MFTGWLHACEGKRKHDFLENPVSDFFEQIFSSFKNK